MILWFALLMQALVVSIAQADTAIISQQQLLQQIDANNAPLILDVRRPDEYSAGRVPKAINIPHTELEKRLDEIRDKMDEEIVVYCESGRRAGIAIDILKQAGFTKILHLEGDMKAWRAQGLPVVGAAEPTAP